MRTAISAAQEFHSDWKPSLGEIVDFPGHFQASAQPATTMALSAARDFEASTGHISHTAHVIQHQRDRYAGQDMKEIIRQQQMC